MAGGGGHLAPTGVPGASMPGALGNQNINEEESQMLGQEMNQGNNETNTNPFLQTYDTPDREWTPQPKVA